MCRLEFQSVAAAYLSAMGVAVEVGESDGVRVSVGIAVLVAVSVGVDEGDGGRVIVGVAVLVTMLVGSMKA